jgi:hypothetical protein
VLVYNVARERGFALACRRDSKIRATVLFSRSGARKYHDVREPMYGPVFGGVSLIPCRPVHASLWQAWTGSP